MMQNSKQNDVKSERPVKRRKPRASDKFGIFNTHELKQLAALYRKQKPQLLPVT